MIKSILLKIMYYITISSYLALNKYIIYKNSVENYQNGTGFMGMYMVKSSESINYINIFILSFTTIFLIDFIMNIITFYINKMKFKEIFIKTSNHLPLIICIIISSGLLFINVALSYITLLIGYLIYFYILNKNINKKTIFIIIIFNIISLFILYNFIL